jgi:hypothetical protein
MLRSIFGTIAVIAFFVLKFTGVQLDNVGTTKVDAVAVSRPVSDTFRAFADGSKMSSDLGKLSDASQITVTLDPNRSITYRISSTIDSDGTTIKINFGDAGANNSTISAEVDVADVRQGNKYISEAKVQKMLKDDINDVAYSLNNHKINEAKLKDINATLISLAVLTNTKSQGEAETLVQGIAEKSLIDEDISSIPSGQSDTFTPSSSDTFASKPATKFGAPTGITGAPSMPTPAPSNAGAGFAYQPSYGSNYGNPNADLGGDQSGSIDADN